MNSRKLTSSLYVAITETSAKQWDYVPVYEGAHYQPMLNGSLAIANVTQREAGYYLCSARNGFGPDASKLIRLTVHGKYWRVLLLHPRVQVQH